MNYYEIKFRGEMIGKVPIEGTYSPNINHKYFLPTEKFKANTKNEVIFYLLGKHCSNVKQNRKKWKDDKTNYHWQYKLKDGTFHRGKAINYKILDRYITKNRYFKYSDFDFTSYLCFWLDRSVDLSINFHVPSGKHGLFIEDATVHQQYSSSIGLLPALDREGHIFSTFQPMLTQRIIQKRNNLIDSSERALQMDWIFEFRELINDIISLVDITLIQIYTKGEYSPLKGWKFDKKIMGEKFNRRFQDKLKWAFQISGNQPNIEKEFPSLKKLKELRNHLNHFDPPTFCVTLEEIEVWLNQIIDVGIILFKIRKAINVDMSEELLSLMIQPIVKFNPEKIFAKRVDLDKNKFGYYSGNWKK